MMKKITLSVLVIVLTAVGLRKLADSIDSHIKLHSLESDRDVAINGSGRPCITNIKKDPIEKLLENIELKENDQIQNDLNKFNKNLKS